MALRGKKPETIEKRLKLFLFGDAGVGKTTAAIQFPHAYIIDGERGTDHYADAIKKHGGEVFQTTDADEVIAEVRALATDKHDFRTVIIDPITPILADLQEKAEKEFGAGDMRVWGKRDKVMRRLMNLLMSLDMNVIMTAHGKIEYGEKMTKLGTTFDGWKRLPYIFDLVIELDKRGSGPQAKRVGNVRKTRLPGFIDGETFDFSYDEIAKRYGVEVVSREAVPVQVAAPERIQRLKQLIETVKLEEGTVEKWLAKVGVDELDDLPAEAAEKCIKHVEGKIAGKAA